MSLSDLIPQHKSDFSAIEKLKTLSDGEFEKIGVHILEWLQDINWPIAKEIKDLIISRQDIMVKYILEALHSDDVSWKYGIVTTILPELTAQNICHLMPTLQSIYANPTSPEIEGAVYHEVVNFLHDHGYENSNEKI